MNLVSCEKCTVIVDSGVSSVPCNNINVSSAKKIFAEKHVRALRVSPFKRGIKSNIQSMQIPKFVDSEHALDKIIRIATNCQISFLDWSCADRDTGDQIFLYKIRVALFRNSDVLNIKKPTIVYPDYIPSYTLLKDQTSSERALATTPSSCRHVLHRKF